MDGPMFNSRFNCTIVKLPLSEQNEFVKHLWRRKNSLCMLKSRLDEQLLNMLFSVTLLSLLVCMICAYFSWNSKEFDINGNSR
jgi:hypothetical protein